MAWSNTIQDENRFWLQSMGDKARIVLKELYPSETQLVERAGAYITLFDRLLAEAASTENQTDINRKAYEAVQDFRKYLLEIIRTQISRKSVISMLPDFLNVFVNECELYLSLLNASLKDIPFSMHALDIASIWTLNAYVAALYVEGRLGVAFLDYKKKTNDYAQKFNVLYIRAQVLEGFLRTGLKDFSILDEFYNDLAAQITDYAEFIVDLIMLQEKQVQVGSLSMLDLDNHYRILCYIMEKLSEFTKLKPPACDPAASRRE